MDKEKSKKNHESEANINSDLDIKKEKTTDEKLKETEDKLLRSLAEFQLIRTKRPAAQVCENF